MLYVIGRDGEKIPVPREVEMEGGEAIRAWMEDRREPEGDTEDDFPVEEESAEGDGAEDGEEESDE